MNKPSLVLFLGSVRPGEFETILSHGHRLGIVLDQKRRATLPVETGFDFVASHDFSRPVDALVPILAAAQREFTCRRLGSPPRSGRRRPHAARGL